MEDDNALEALLASGGFTDEERVQAILQSQFQSYDLERVEAPKRARYSGQQSRAELSKSTRVRPSKKRQSQHGQTAGEEVEASIATALHAPPVELRHYKERQQQEETQYFRDLQPADTACTTNHREEEEQTPGDNNRILSGDDLGVDHELDGYLSQDDDDNTNGDNLDVNASHDWAKRQRDARSRYATIRPRLLAAYLSCEGTAFTAHICGICGKHLPTGTCVRCLDCDVGKITYLCYGCDSHQHNRAHFHRRQACQHGFWEPLPARVEFTHDGQLCIAEKLFDLCPRECDHCNIAGAFEGIAPTTGDRLIYILHGRHEFVKAKYICPHCNRVQQQGAVEFVTLGAFPCTVEQVETVVDMRILKQWDVMMAEVPRASLQGFLSMLTEISKDYGSEGEAINQDAFKVAYNEYKYLQVDVRRMQMKMDDMCCPSCSGGMYSVHIDGNMKLFTWIRNGQGEQPSYYKNLFFSDDGEVIQHLAMADRALGVDRATTDEYTCGGVWKAAKDVSAKMAGKHYTGRIVGEYDTVSCLGPKVSCRARRHMATHTVVGFLK